MTDSTPPPTNRALAGAFTLTLAGLSYATDGTNVLKVDGEEYLDAPGAPFMATATFSVDDTGRLGFIGSVDPRTAVNMLAALTASLAMSVETMGRTA